MYFVPIFSRQAVAMLFAVVASHFFTSFSIAQSVAVVNNRLPTVYLEYDSSVTRSRKDGTILLQLHNNTSTSINVGANFDTRLASLVLDGTFEAPDVGVGTYMKSGSEVELCYGAEGLFLQKGYSLPKKSPNPKITDLRNSCEFRSNGKRVDDPYSMGYWIRSKEFVRFRVPADLLREGLKIYTEFRYPWEFANGRVRLNEPKHRVYFFYSDITDRKN